MDEAIERAYTRYQNVPFEDLSEVERVLVAVSELEGDVNNGGFHQYYFNSSGNTAHYAPVALRAIGAWAAAAITEKANQQFGPGGPLPSRNQRQEALDALSPELWDDLDAEFFAYPDDIAALLQRFVEASRER